MLIRFFDLPKTIDRLFEQLFAERWFAVWPLDDL